jgi:hypothetical protein
MGLWVVAGAWCSDQLTDGHVPRDMLTALGGRTADARALVTAGLWTEDGDGWTFHDWLTMNPSRSDVEAKRDQERERKSEWRARKAKLRAEGSDSR